MKIATSRFRLAGRSSMKPRAKATSAGRGGLRSLAVPARAAFAPPVNNSDVESALLFQHPTRKVQRTGLRAFWGELVHKLSPKSAASCLITGDEELRRMNREFRRKDYATDVLSFPSEYCTGEIAISFDRAAAQAAELGHGVEDELRILMLHGMLHLTGLDHETDSGEMGRAETRWRKKLGLPSGLIERTEKSQQVERTSKPKKKARTR